ncbi:hypothetical protein BC332_05784 [Capsicum chinense]|nr:hypothetical protein BC332_05784 [Capsicum chinense]
MPSRNRDISSRRELPIQDGDAALALRLQREEFMESFTTRSSAEEQQYRSSLALAKANLRAMASRAINIREGVRLLMAFFGESLSDLASE